MRSIAPRRYTILSQVKESGFSLKDKKSKFSLKSELRFISTKFKRILIEEVIRN